jgi:hypothetical protein
MAKARHKPEYHATVYDFRDADIMFKIADNTNGTGISSPELAELMGFEAEDGARPIGIRLAWMKRYGMVAYDDKRQALEADAGRAACCRRAPDRTGVEGGREDAGREDGRDHGARHFTLPARRDDARSHAPTRVRLRDPEAMSKLPKEARDGLMRVWCAILEERTGIKHTPKS